VAVRLVQTKTIPAVVTAKLEFAQELHVLKLQKERLVLLADHLLIANRNVDAMAQIRFVVPVNLVLFAQTHLHVLLVQIQ
jgi:hypothetical protein